MTAAFLRRSLAKWRRRVAYRAAKLADARKTGHADAKLSSAEVARINKWKRNLDEAQKMVAVREKQLAAKTPLREKAWAQMQAFIDAKVTEQGGNNHGREVEAIIRANGGTPGEPWCGDTVAACYLKAGARSVTRAWASVRMLEKLLMRVRSPRRGHVVTYVFDHTGLFGSWLTPAEIASHGLTGTGWFFAGEGNTGDSGAQSDSVTGGDGVKLKVRHKDQVAGFWRVQR